ncbi:Natural killer cells antigen CD94 [Galemys pyrenaicus]|uniref:Natural killer cells antigen CD94 n=1 Tax=Galemys pyrenaicus TaxID=202257 RepID=A0A8J5ZQU5_GALPY|nr:Natural killer cells antigen CD94 [Galemys pyrenaicus]
MAALGIALEKDSGYSSCQEGWVGYECNCYFISSESRSWHESRAVCVSMNSSLLQMHSRDELAHLNGLLLCQQHFMSSSLRFFWVGATYSAGRGAWEWEDGSAVSRETFPFFKTANTTDCMLYSPKGHFLNEPCKKTNPYICKQQPT